MATQFSTTDNIPWKQRFFSIWIGQAFSLLGSQLVSFALVWYLTVRTGSATVLAIASMFGILPRVILGPFIGPLLDRWNRRRVMIAADGLIALATMGLSLLFFLGEPPLIAIYLLMLVRSATGAFHGNAMSASTSLMVPVEHLPRVQGFNQMLNGGLSVVAAPLGAILYESLAFQWILMLDVFTAIIAILPLFFFDVPQPDRQTSESLSGQASTYWQDLIAGFRYMWNWKGIFLLSMMAAILNFLLTPTFSIVPLLIKDYFGGSAIEVGAFEAAAGAGMIVGGLILGVWGGFKRQILTSMAGVSLLGVGVLTIGLLPPNLFFVVVIAGGVIGFSMPFTNGAIFSIMQSQVAPDMQGRVFSLMTTMAAAMSPIGLAVAGPISDYVDVRIWFILAGIVCIVIGIGGVLTPTIYNIEENNANAAPSPELAQAVTAAED